MSFSIKPNFYGIKNNKNITNSQVKSWNFFILRINFWKVQIYQFMIFNFTGIIKYCPCQTEKNTRLYLQISYNNTTTMLWELKYKIEEKYFLLVTSIKKFGKFLTHRDRDTPITGLLHIITTKSKRVTSTSEQSQNLINIILKWFYVLVTIVKFGLIFVLKYPSISIKKILGKILQGRTPCCMNNVKIESIKILINTILHIKLCEILSHRYRDIAVIVKHSASAPPIK